MNGVAAALSALAEAGGNVKLARLLVDWCDCRVSVLDWADAISLWRKMDERNSGKSSTK
jgi:hypothetical protein